MQCQSTLVKLSDMDITHGTGQRHDSGKPDWSLMPLDQVAMIIDEMQHPDEWQMPVIDPIYLFKLISTFQSDPSEENAKTLVIHSFGFLIQHFSSNASKCFEEIIAVWSSGERKYNAFNWMKGMPWSKPLACYMRHLNNLWQGIVIDKESGRHHGAHLVCNAMMLLHYVNYYQDGNDLPHRWYKPME